MLLLILRFQLKKLRILEDAYKEVDKLNYYVQYGFSTDLERNEKVINLWQETTKKVGEAVKNHMDPNGNLAIMASSGATKGGFGPITQLAGMRGLMADPAGRIIRLPITSNFREGLTALEYFISTHGARKGLADTALTYCRCRLPDPPSGGYRPGHHHQ